MPLLRMHSSDVFIEHSDLGLCSINFCYTYEFEYSSIYKSSVSNQNLLLSCAVKSSKDETECTLIYWLGVGLQTIVYHFNWKVTLCWRSWPLEFIAINCMCESQVTIRLECTQKSIILTLLQKHFIVIFSLK